MLLRYSLALAFTLFIFIPSLQAQQAAENDAIIKVVRRLFEGMEKGDSAMVRSTFAKDVTMATMRRNKENNGQLSRENSIAGFLKAVGTPHPDIWYEEIWNIKIDLQEIDLYEEDWCDEKEGRLQESLKKPLQRITSEHADHNNAVFTIGDDDANDAQREGLLPEQSISNRIPTDVALSKLPDFGKTDEFVDIDVHASTENTVTIDSRQA